ncbi:MAG TPA: two-component regulator propeller domain-containing protein, partial [Gaiellaceae bacterium]
MAIGPRGDVLVATDHGVAYRDGGRWRTVAFSAGVGAPLATVRSVFVDREGTTWLGAAGLVQVRGRGVVEHHDAANGLPGDVVWSYQRDRAGTLWAGTNRCLARAIQGEWGCFDGTRNRVVRSFAFTSR